MKRSTWIKAVMVAGFPRILICAIVIYILATPVHETVHIIQYNRLDIGVSEYCLFGNKEVEELGSVHGWVISKKRVTIPDEIVLKLEFEAYITEAIFILSFFAMTLIWADYETRKYIRKEEKKKVAGGLPHPVFAS